MIQFEDNMPIGIRQLMTSVTHLKEGEKVLIIADDNQREIAEFVYSYVKKYFDTTMCVMTPRASHGQEPTEMIAAAMEHCDVALGITTMSLYHSNARKKNTGKKTMRWVGMQGYQMAMFNEGGLTADFDMVREQVNRVATSYRGKIFHLTTPGGTDLTCSVEGREPVKDFGTAIHPGEACGTPNAEIALGPVEGTSEGVLVIDGSIPHPLLDLIHEPITCKVEHGVITEITGGREADVLRKVLADYNDPTVYNVGELGMGLNPLCRLRGVMSEDEGSFGNMHIGIGKNTSFGGHVDSPLHLDMVVKTVTAQIDDTIIMKDGKLLV